MRFEQQIPPIPRSATACCPCLFASGPGVRFRTEPARSRCTKSQQCRILPGAEDPGTSDEAVGWRRDNLDPGAAPPSADPGAPPEQTRDSTRRCCFRTRENSNSNRRAISAGDKLRTNAGSEPHGCQQLLKWGGGGTQLARRSRNTTSTRPTFNPRLSSNFKFQLHSATARFSIDSTRPQLLIGLKHREIVDVLCCDRSRDAGAWGAGIRSVGAIGQLEVSRKSLDLRTEYQDQQKRVDGGRYTNRHMRGPRPEVSATRNGYHQRSEIKRASRSARTSS